MYKGVIFDLDGTLYDYDLCLQNAEENLFIYMKKVFNIKVEFCRKILNESKTEVKKILKNTASSHNRFLYMKKICEKLNVDSFLYCEKMYNIYWNSFFDKMKLFNFVLPLFKKLKNKRIKIAILTDLTTKIQYKKINKLGICKYINYILTSEEVGVDKPDKKMFKGILKKMKLNKKDVLIIGDDKKKDIDGARAFGINGILINKFSNLDDIILKIGI